ncbi:MAG: DUF1080 domain-containing protein [Chlorobi bacterium]|nr:DUF1080 domain-containing protein [Chlorobiota bacterium]
MKNLTFVTLLILFALLFSCNNTKKKEVKPNTLTKSEQEHGWKLLFNGENLDGWRMFNGGEVTGWKVVDGVLQNSGVGSDHGGDIITTEPFENFELTLDWKITPGSNSGIFFHVREGVVDAIYKSGPEYQLVDDEGWPTKLRPSQHSGANYAMDAPQNAKTKPTGEWNSAKIIVDGTHVEHWLNGVKVVEYELWSDEWKAMKEAGKWKEEPYYGMAKKGYIGLQDHGGLTMFKNIKIREL